MSDTLTYISDRIRITLGDSECPLGKKCPGYDGENGCCVSYRGREEIGGGRAECYKLFKPQIRAQRAGLLEMLAGKITAGFQHIGGEKD